VIDTATWLLRGRLVSHESYETTVAISATPDAVWRVLSDGGRYTERDSGVERLEGTIALGGTIKVFAKISPNREFPVKVIELAPAEAMTWKGGMPLGLFKGVRTFKLASEGEGVTRSTMREEFSGPMLPLIWKSMPDLQPSFDQFANGLKSQCEAAA
jgi:hypothetical protein